MTSTNCTNQANGPLTQAELYAALDGLMAYDLGATDSGIHDERLRARVKDQLQALSEEEFRFTISRFVRDACLAEDQLAAGYGIEDVRDFINWLSREMGIDI
jgi:hypothetical protein